MPKRRLFLVRHGETVGASSIRYYGRTDVMLSELGQAQMRAARALLETRCGLTRFDAVFSSGLARAHEGAQIVAGPNAAIVEIDELDEVDFGSFEGLTDAEIRGRYPAEHAQWNRDRIAPEFTYPGGENRAAFTRRVERGLARMLSLFGEGETALLVAHRGVIRAIMRRLCGIAPHIDLGSIQLVEEDGARWCALITDLEPAPPIASRGR